MSQITILNTIIQKVYHHFHNKGSAIRSIQINPSNEGYKGDVLVTKYFENDDDWDLSDPYSYTFASEDYLDPHFLEKMNAIMKFALYGESTPFYKPYMISHIEEKDDGYNVYMKRYRDDVSISFHDEKISHYIEPYMTKNIQYYSKYALLRQAIKQGNDLKDMWDHIIGKEKSKLNDLRSVESNATITHLIKTCEKHITRQQDHFKKLESYYELKKDMERNMREKTPHELEILERDIHIDFFM